MKKCHRFEEKKKDRGVGDVEEGFEREQVDSCRFFGEKKGMKGLLKLLEHVGRMHE